MGAPSWHPADTAPRDGTPFVGLLANGHYALVTWPGEGRSWWDAVTMAGSVIVPIEPKWPGTALACWHALLARPEVSKQGWQG